MHIEKCKKKKSKVQKNTVWGGGQSVADRSETNSCIFYVFPIRKASPFFSISWMRGVSGYTQRSKNILQVSPKCFVKSGTGVGRGRGVDPISFPLGRSQKNVSLVAGPIKSLPLPSDRDKKPLQPTADFI